MEPKNDNTPSKILFDQKKAEKARGVERGGSGRASAGSVVMGDGAPIPGGVAVGTACLSSGHGPLGVPQAIGACADAATRPSISESPVTPAEASRLKHRPHQSVYPDHSFSHPETFMAL